MDVDFFTETLKQIQYALAKILNAVDVKNLDAIKFIAKQEFKAIEYDLRIIKGDKK